MTSLMLASEHHRGQGATDTVVRDWAEAVKKKAITNTAYVQCPQWTPDLDPGFAFPTGFDMAGLTPTVEYWVPDTVANPQVGKWKDRNACTNYYVQKQCSNSQIECDPGMQRVKLKVAATSGALRGATTETLVIVRRGNP
jgi:hypothetical protein